MTQTDHAPVGAPEVLFLGETQRDSYVEGVLSTAFTLTKLNAREQLAETEAEQKLDQFDLVVFSDYPSRHLTSAHQARLADAVQRSGHGLLMIGGWASFGGPLSSYHASQLADLLPVEISSEDDRVNSPLGTVFVARRDEHPVLRSVRDQEQCIVVGYNAVRPRNGASTLVDGFRLRIDTRLSPSLEKVVTPMLSVWERGNGRVAALAPDLMPHWAGGIVDWGDERIKLPTGNEVGHLYVAFLLDLCRWLMGLER